MMKRAEYRWKPGQHTSPLELPGRIGEAVIAWDRQQAVRLAQLFHDEWRDSKAAGNLSRANSVSGAYFKLWWAPPGLWTW
jgi:hypothetical protein